MSHFVKWCVFWLLNCGLFGFNVSFLIYNAAEERYVHAGASAGASLVAVFGAAASYERLSK